MSSEPTTHTSEQQQLIEQLSFLGQMLSTEAAHYHQTASSKQGLGVTDSKAISALMQEGPMTAGQLAERLSLTTGAVTSVIDRLEHCDAIKRVADPNDRRKVVVHTNPEKIKEAAKIYDSIGQSFAELLATYSVEQLRFLVDYYKAAIELTKQEVSKLSNNSAF
jgi:DNA-binding MarR family transcriptional regulator